MNLGPLREILIPHIESMLSYQFTFQNPVFWIFILLIFALMCRLWDIKKSLSFSVSIAVILLAATKIEHMTAESMTRAGEAFDPIITRLLSGVVIALVVLYYIFIKSDSNF